MVQKRPMIDHAVQSVDREGVEAVLRKELARGDGTGETVLPVLRHLLAAGDGSLFGDDILARIRGMLDSLAGALPGDAAGHSVRTADAEVLTRALLADPALLSHLHALALEWQLTERLRARLAIDPVVSPLLQTLISAEDDPTRDLAMKFLAAQARWSQSQRCMTLSLFELPGELFDAVLATLRSHSPAGEQRANDAEGALRNRYDESASRLVLASRLVARLGGGAFTALPIDQAGTALFLTALALGSAQKRDAIVLWTHETQAARLALALRSAGLDTPGVERQLLALHPAITLQQGFDEVGRDMAAEILSSGRFSS